MTPHRRFESVKPGMTKAGGRVILQRNEITGKPITVLKPGRTPAQQDMRDIIAKNFRALHNELHAIRKRLGQNTPAQIRAVSNGNRKQLRLQRSIVERAGSRK